MPIAAEQFGILEAETRDWGCVERKAIDGSKRCRTIVISDI